MVGLNILSFGINHTKISISFGLIEIKYWYNIHNLKLLWIYNREKNRFINP